MPRSAVSLSEEWFVGRADELATVRSCVHAASAGDGVVVWLEGDAGSGKSAFVARALSELPEGFVVLRAGADESTIERVFAVTEQFGVGTAGGPFAVGLELLASLTGAGQAGPVAVVVEDLHWADRESRQALLTAARRLDKDRVVLVVTSRPGGTVADGWDRFSLDASRCQRIMLGGLSRDEVAEMAGGAGVALPPRAVERLHRHTGGLALYVRTLLRELTPSQLVSPGGELPVPRSLASTVLARVGELSVDARTLAAALAVANAPVALSAAGRIAGVERPTGALEELLSTGFVTWRSDEADTPTAFAHPLYRAAVYADLSPTRRRELHRAAAEALDAGSALGHRVAGTDGIDDDLARELVEAAAREEERGARGVAARYLLWASSIGSARPANEERLLQAARLLLADGQTARAAGLRLRIEGCGDTRLRSLVLGMLAWEESDTVAAERWLVEASPSAGVDGPDRQVATAALAHLGLMYYTQGRAAEAIETGTTLLAFDGLSGEVERSGWSALAVGEAMERGAAAGLDCLAGRLPQSADAVAAADADLLIVRGALGFYAGRTTAAIADLRAAILLARHGAAAVQLPRAHVQLAQLLLSWGEWDEAILHARVALSLVSDERRVWMEAQTHAALARLLAARGDWDVANEHVRAGRDAAATLGTVEAVATTRIAEAAVARARGESVQVVESLGPLVADGAAVPMATSLAWWPTLIAAMIEREDLDGAAAQIDLLDEAAEQRGLDLRARIVGGRARLESARGRPDQAASGYRQAIALLGADDPLLDRAELHHDFGRLLAAQGKRRAALDQLRAAHGLLIGVRAEPFLRRVEADLASVGVSAGRRGSRSPLELTEREQDVAVLVSKGMTNREVGAELYISAKAVDYHLGNIFGKLGITSRRDLRQRLDN